MREASVSEASSRRTSAAVKSAHRTIEILELLADRADRLTLSELRRELGVPKSSLHALLQTLVAGGWLETDDRGTSYGIGLRALRIGTAYLEHDVTTEAAGPVLARLRRELDETVHLARLDGADVVYLASRESAHHLRSSSRVGRRLPAHATALGKALLATRTDQEVEALLPSRLVALTPDTVTTQAGLCAKLAATRVRGWSFEQGQNTPGLGCFGVAVPTRQPVVDALSCSVPLARLTDERGTKIVAALARGADELCRLARRGAPP